MLVIREDYSEHQIASNQRRLSAPKLHLGHPTPHSNYYRNPLHSSQLFKPIKIQGILEIKTGRTLGTGSFGRVKVATHLESGQVLALKILQKEAIKVTRQEKNIMNETKDGPADYLAAMTGPDDEDSDEQF